MTDSAVVERPNKQSATYQDGVRLIHKYAGRQITEADAQEAARNLIAFGRLALEIARDISQDGRHGDRT